MREPSYQPQTQGGIKIVDGDLKRFTSDFTSDAVRLFGVSGFRMHDANASGVPAVSFAIDIPPSSATQAAVMLSLPTELLGNGTSVTSRNGRVLLTQGTLLLSLHGPMPLPAHCHLSPTVSRTVDGAPLHHGIISSILLIWGRYTCAKGLKLSNMIPAVQEPQSMAPTDHTPACAALLLYCLLPCSSKLLAALLLYCLLPSSCTGGDDLLRARYS